MDTFSRYPEEKFLCRTFRGVYDGPFDYVVSPDGRHIASAHRAHLWGSEIPYEWKVTPDGIPHRGYGIMWPSALAYSPDGSKLAYVAAAWKVAPKPGVRAEFGEPILVFNGEEKQEFHALLWVEPTFSPDGRHFAYGASLRGMEAVVLDGNPQQTHNRVRNIVFSPDSQHWAYVATSSAPWVRLLLGADRFAHHYVVVDGNAQPACGKIRDGTLAFTPDSNRVAYVARAGRKDMVTVGGQLGPAFPKIVSPLVFSRDGKRLAFVARWRRKNLVVVDGAPAAEDDAVCGDSLSFSPDGTRLAYSVHSVQGGFVVVDGRKGRLYEEIRPGCLQFSPDGKVVAYAARSGERYYIIRNEEEYPLDENLYIRRSNDITFSPDGRHLLYVTSSKDQPAGGQSGGRAGVETVWIDQERGRQYSYVYTPGRVVFDSPREFHYLAEREGSIYLVSERFHCAQE